MKKEKYITAEAEIILFEIEDVITTSINGVDDLLEDLLNKNVYRDPIDNRKLL